MNSVFSEQILADKLSKLNSTQQCIETLSHWCIFHRKKAEQVVQTWGKQFHNSQKEQKIPFLYLANDILQNSRRKGNEFVGEFWKVLPSALKDVVENGDDHGRNVVSRLVGIWEERRVFGSRAQGLKDLMLGNEPPPSLEFNKKRSRSVRIVRRDSRSIRIKLSIGGTAEKIVSAFHSVLSEHPNEEIDLNKCKAAVHRVGKMEKDVDIACSRGGDLRESALVDELQEQETILKQCIGNLKSVETSRASLVSQLKEALMEQESQLENIRTQLQVAQAQAEEAMNMQRKLKNEPIVPSTTPVTGSQENSNTPTSETHKKSAAAIAAEVADKLAASTHSQQIMTSVLSTFAAEAAKNASLGPSSNPSTSSFPEKPMQGSEPNTFLAAQQLPAHQHQQPMYNIFSASTPQYLQPSGGVMIGVPYTYSTLPPPPPPPQMMNLARPSSVSQQQQQMTLIQPPPPPQAMALQQPLQINRQAVPMTLQQPAPPSYRPLQPPSMAFYHQSQ